MTITWTLELHCDHCNANVFYDTEIPEIKHDRSNIILNNRAKKFLNENHVYDSERDTPPNVHRHMLLPYYIMTELPTRYTLCPVCGDRIYFGD